MTSTPKHTVDDWSAGVAMIAAERKRHVEEKGYTSEVDAGRTDELARAAAVYAMPLRVLWLKHSWGLPDAWPWDRKFWKPKPEDRTHELVKAGALIAAAIDTRLAEGKASQR